MNVTQLYASLLTSIGRGSSVTANLPEWCQEAVNDLESAATYKWMERYYTGTANPGLDGNVIPLPNVRAKAIDFVRPVTFNNTTGAIQYGLPLAGVTAHEFASVDAGYPAGGFYLSGVSDVVLDGLPPSPTSYEVCYWEYTEWPTDGSETPAILARHFAATKALVMACAARNLRDERLAQVWQGTATRAEQALWLSDGIDGQVGMKHRRGMRQREAG